MGDTLKDSPVAIDLFAGAGGLSEGLLAAGIDVAVALEKHPHAALTYAFNHPRTRVLCGNIRSVSLATVKAAVYEVTGQRDVDLIVGGPPCQGYSPAGKRRKNDRRNGFYLEFLRFVAYFNPKLALFENVPGFANFDGGAALKAVLNRFRSLGYRVFGFDENSKRLPTELPILDSSFYGVPQRRHRLLLVAWRPDEAEEEFEWPAATHAAGERDGLETFVTVKDAIGDLDFLTAGYECHWHIGKTTNKYQVARRNGCTNLFNHLATKHRKSTVNMYRRLAQGDTIRTIPEDFRTGKQTMRRLESNRVSKAVLALPDDLVHYGRLRIPTVREMARLQSFDDDYVFLGKRTTSDLSRRVDVPQYTQVGNAVPPLLGKALGQALLRTMGRASRDIRDLQTRRKRHEWLRGSSGFSGYALAIEAARQILFLDLRGRYKALPHVAGAKPFADRKKPMQWKRLPLHS
jgi:DNA (cytosine-5)-methyltransferase 1